MIAAGRFINPDVSDLFLTTRASGWAMNAPLRVLVVICTSPLERYHTELSLTVARLCAAPDVDVDVFINVYSGTLAWKAPCVVQNVTERTHKGWVWKKWLTPSYVRQYDYLWLLDSDIDACAMSLVNTTRFMSRLELMISQPRVRAALGAKRASDHAQLSIDSRSSHCESHCDLSVNIIEVMAPIFTRRAWTIVYEELLSRLADSVLKRHVAYIDTVWCPFLQHHLNRSVNQPVCALPSTQTVEPITHLDGRSIERAAASGLKVQRSLKDNTWIKTIPMREVRQTCRWSAEYHQLFQRSCE